MEKRVAIFGGGIGGLSAAQELAERGFDVVVYEGRGSFGGKARSVSVPNTGIGGRKDLPGEHGFRFFPGFYKHVTNTMQRIPYGSNPRGVFDNLVEATRTQIARVGKSELILPDEFPQSADDWATALRALFAPDLGIPKLEIDFFINKLLILLTSCEERRVAEYEKIPWWQFIDAANKSEAYQRLLAQGQTRSLVAMRAEIGSTRTVGYTLLQLYLGALSPSSFDRLLNGPTSDVWIDPWVSYLRGRGVEMRAEAPLQSLHTDGKAITKAVVVQGGLPVDIQADFYVAALPVEIMATLVSEELKAAAPSLANLGLLRTAWMNGMQFYLDRDVPVVHGHSLYVDSPWALTSVSQKQFWQSTDLRRYGDGRVEGILSVCISDWEAPGVLYSKPAVKCTAEEIRNEVWAQLKMSLNDQGRPELDDANVLSWFLDPDIQFPNPTTVTNLEPLLVNTAGSLPYRPDAKTELRNLFLASDYVKTYTDIACMEAANEAARRAVNALLDAAGSNAARAQLWPLQEPEFFRPMKEYDRLLFKLGLPHTKLA
ncbi:MAG: FAD-dependent oxidoreductase [Terriglobia bacterium]